MVTMFVRHMVGDYGKWKKVYDELGPVRSKMGVTGASVHRDASDPTTIIVTHQFKDLKSAQVFGDSQELKAAMKKAGVSGPPEIWFGDDIERTKF